MRERLVPDDPWYAQHREVCRSMVDLGVFFVSKETEGNMEKKQSERWGCSMRHLLSTTRPTKTYLKELRLPSNHGRAHERSHPIYELTHIQARTYLASATPPNKSYYTRHLSKTPDTTGSWYVRGHAKGSSCGRLLRARRTGYGGGDRTHRYFHGSIAIDATA